MAGESRRRALSNGKNNADREWGEDVYSSDSEVHTTEDPGSPTGFGHELNAPISETADAIAHYFEPNELLNLLAGHLRIVHYEDRREWDHTHGRPHVHGKAVALAVPKNAHPPYRGDNPEHQVGRPVGR